MNVLHICTYRVCTIQLAAIFFPIFLNFLNYCSCFFLGRYLPWILPIVRAYASLTMGCNMFIVMAQGISSWVAGHAGISDVIFLEHGVIIATLLSGPGACLSVMQPVSRLFSSLKQKSCHSIRLLRPSVVSVKKVSCKI
jgi:hypothetical protein